MDFGLKNKVAVIIGGSKGLGLASAESLLREECKIVICSRNQENLDKAAETFKKIGGTYITKIADYNNKSERQTLFENINKELGRIDILVCSSGGPKMGKAKDMELEDYRSALENNLLSMIACAKNALPSMQENKWGRIIFITTQGAVQPVPDLVLSNITRSALQAFAKTLANEVSKEGITVNCIMPARIDTERVQEIIQSWAQTANISYKEQLTRDVMDIPVGRFGTTEEFGDAVCFLCSTQASYITGSALSIDGGSTKGTR